jgi:hypothetical protein
MFECYSLFKVLPTVNCYVCNKNPTRGEGYLRVYECLKKEGYQKNVLNGKFRNTRPVGRPRIRWEDAVQKDALQMLGTRGWRRRAENRDEWR